MNDFAAKLLTDLRGEKVVKNKSFKSRAEFSWSFSFLDRTVAARRVEILAESTTGISPGDRGKVGDNWCRLPLTTAKAG